MKRTHVFSCWSVHYFVRYSLIRETTLISLGKHRHTFPPFSSAFLGWPGEARSWEILPIVKRENSSCHSQYTENMEYFRLWSMT